MKKNLLAVLLGLCCLGAANPDQDAPAPFLPEDYEQRQVATHQYRQSRWEGILITGTEEYLARVTAALALIEATDSRSWHFVRKHVRLITLNGHAGMDVGAGRITTDDARRGGVVNLAAQIIHEAWHRELSWSGLACEGRVAEIFCIAKQNEFLRRSRLPTIDLDEALRSEYWTVDYWSRNW
jgi:hypothetical protein